MNIRTIFKAFAFFLLVMPAVAQAFTVKGRFVESATGIPCEAVQYSIFFACDTVKSVISSSSDLQGVFSLNLTDAGKYILKASYPRMLSVSVPFELSDAVPTVDLGDISFNAGDKQLEEVVVVARRELIRSDGAKLTYDVERDPTSGNSSVMEMLRKVPMVSVDGEDNIKVQGQSNFKIYVNGKPDPMLSGDPKAVLKAMPASSIKKIEVITDPGAKYEAEGTVGILNIITTSKQSLEGYSGNVRSGFNTGNYGGSVYLLTKVRNVTVAARLNGYNGSILRNHSRSCVERENLNDDINHFYRTYGKTVNKFTYWQGGFDISWEPDTLNLFTFSANYAKQTSNGHTEQSVTMSSIDDVLQWSYNRDFTTRYNRIGVSANASYQHTFSNSKQHTLTVTYQFDYGRTPSDNDQRTGGYVNFPSSYEPFRLHNTHNYYGIHTMQIDYVLPLFGEKHTFETGAKAVIRPNRESEWVSSSTDGVNYTTDSFIRLTQNNDVYAGYISYNARFGKFSSRAGLRYEYTRLGIDYHRLVNTNDYNDFERYLGDWVPNASLTYNLTNGSNVRAAYSMRIWRPSVNQLNPFVNDLTFGEISYGNPELKSQKYHKVELKYSNYGGKLGGEFSVGYSQSNNSIETYSFMQDDLLHDTYANIGHERIFNLGMYGEYGIITGMSFSAWVGSYYTHYEAKSLDNAKKHGWRTNVNLNFSYTMPWKLRLDAWGGFSTPWIDLQSKSDKNEYYYGLSLSRTFLPSDKLLVGISANGFLEGNRSGSYNTEGPGFRNKYSYSYHPWQIGVYVNYNFGSLRSDVKRTRSSISNDDISSETTGSKGGS